MKPAIIIFVISLVIQIMIRTRKYDLMDKIDGTLEAANTMNKMTTLTLIASFIVIVVLW